MPKANPHFLTTRTQSRLFAALALSLLLHLLPFAGDFDFGPKSQSTVTPPLQAELRQPPPAAVPLSLPEQPKPAETQPPPAPPRPTAARKPSQPTARNWVQTVREHLNKLDTAGQFYPAEAIARGLEGEALVLLVLDESGQVAGARLEQSSGHALLDEAALRAVRSLRSLPADAPRQTVLPIRFRLK